MIRADVKVENIRMSHACRLIDLGGRARPAPVTLTILHDQGRVVGAWQDEKGRVDVGPTVSPSMERAADLAAAHGASDVRLIDLGTRERYLREVQAPDPAYGMDAADHWMWLHEKKWGMGGGLILYPKRELFRGPVPLDRAKRFLDSRLGSEGVFFLGVTEGGDWWATLLVLVEDGQIVRLSTVDDLPEEFRIRPPGGGAGDMARAAAARCGRKAAALLVPRDLFEAFAEKGWSGLGALPIETREP